MNAVDQNAFMVGLNVGKGNRARGALCFCCGDYLGESGATVESGLAGAKEVEVGAVDEEDGAGHFGLVDGAMGFGYSDTSLW